MSATSKEQRGREAQLPAYQPASTYKKGELHQNSLNTLNKTLAKAKSANPENLKVVVYLDVDETLLFLTESETHKKIIFNPVVMGKIKEIKKDFPQAEFRLLTARPGNGIYQGQDQALAQWSLSCITSIGNIINELKKETNIHIPVSAVNFTHTVINEKIIGLYPKITVIRFHNQIHFETFNRSAAPYRINIWMEDNKEEIAAAERDANSFSMSSMLLVVKVCHGGESKLEYISEPNTLKRKASQINSTTISDKKLKFSPADSTSTDAKSKIQLTSSSIVPSSVANYPRLKNLDFQQAPKPYQVALSIPLGIFARPASKINRRNSAALQPLGTTTAPAKT